MRAMVLTRWVWRSTRADLLAWAMPRWLALGLLMVELDVIVDWRALAHRLERAPAWAVGVAVALGTMLCALDGDRLVRTVLLGPRLGVLRRQPVPGWAWGPAALVVLAPVVAPMGVAGAVWYGAGAGWVALWLALGLLPAMVGRLGLLPASVAAGGVAAGAHLTGAPWAWAAGCAAGSTLAAGFLALSRGDDRPRAPFSLSPLRPRGAATMLLHRDVLTLWRTELFLWTGSALGLAVVGGTAGLMYRSGDWAGSALTFGTLVALAAMGPLSLAVGSAVARRLGRRLDPPEWPVTALQRAATLAAVAAGSLVPGWAAAAVMAPTIGVGHVRIGAFLAAIGAGAAWWVASRPTRPNPGTWPYWLAACLAGALAPGGGFWAFALAGLALHRATRAFERRRVGP